jgi:hypothetical protein
MSQFRSTGGLDDSIADAGDRGFYGVNRRLQLNQLEAGEVRESLNGRMEGFWKPRKAVIAQKTSLTTAGTPLRLPFFVIDTDKTIASASRTSNVVTITTSSNHGLTGTAYVTLGNTATPAVQPLTGIAAGSFLMTVTGVNTLTFANNGADGSLTVGATGYLRSQVSDNVVSDVRASCLFSNPNESNKEYILVATNAGVKKIEVSKLADAGTAGVTDLTFPTNITLDAGVEVSMLQVFDKVIIFRGGQSALQWDGVSTQFYKVPGGPYQAGKDYTKNNNIVISDGTATITIDTGDLQASTGIAKGVGISYDISSATAGTNIVTIVTSTTHGLTTGDSVLISGITQSAGPDPNGTRVVTVTNTTTFTIPLTGATGTYTVAGATVRKASNTIMFPAFFDDGFIPSPVENFYNNATLSISAATRTINDYNGSTKVATLATGSFFPDTEYAFTALQDNPFSIGQSLRLTQTSTAFKVLNVGDILNVSAIPTYNTWQFFTSEPDVSTHTIHYSQQESIGLGFSYMPGPPWATYFQRRLWMPYLYENGGTLTSSTYTSRGIADEIIASDILDSNTYDRVLNQFRISGGTADYVVAMHGFYDDALVVMNRNSIHAVVGTQGSLADTVVKELTSEVGCLSRKSVVMQANNLLFLSDNGVYALTFLNDYNLRGTEEPLSKNIQPYIDRINARLAVNSTAVYYDNRYYLAVPLDSVAGAGDAQGNNAILVFNFLNKGWESLDTYGSSGFLITDFITAGAGVRNDLYAVSSSGGIHKMEAADAQNDSISSEFGSTTLDVEPINSSLTTRGYDLGTQERKRFTDFQTQMQSFPAGSPSTFNVSFSTEDPDNAFPIGSTNELIGDLSNTDQEEETANVRGRLGGLRGYTGTMILTRVLGSPKVHSVKISGAVSNRAIISQK